MTRFKIGDRVRSYDFPLDDEHYIEGVVKHVGVWEHCEFKCSYPHLHILVDRDTLGDRVGEMVYPVHPSSEALGFFTGRRASRIEIVYQN